MKRVSWILALVVGLAIGFFARSSLFGGGRPPALAPAPAPAARPARAQEDPKAIYRVPVDDSPTRGPADALVTIVEVSDFECPFCKRVIPTLHALDEAYPGKLRWVFKHNPLPFHPHARPAAEAAEEARAEGGPARFWTMHDRLFEQSPALDDASLERVARDAGVDPARVRAAVADRAWEARIQRDAALAASLGASGTPSFFVNGRKLVGAQPLEAFKAAVDDALQRAQALVAAGTPPARVYDAIAASGATSTVYLPGGEPPAAPRAPPPTPYRNVPVRADDAVRGPADAPLTVVLFSDFQCPFCARVEPTLDQLQKAFPKEVRIVWRNLPLPMHPNAMPAALAAEAARQQGKFWPFHDLLFANQQALSPADLERDARKLGLDLRRYQAAIGARASADRIADDGALARTVGASGTPTMFFNCRQVVGAIPFESMRAIAEEELKKARGLPGAAARRDAGLYGRACQANLALAAAGPTAAAAPAPGPLKVELRPDDPSIGSPSAPVTIVLFSDFQCPYCGRLEPTLRQVEQAYGDKVRIVWKHKPLPFHPNALPAALAAEAAREQGKFWQMHDRMFAAQQELSPAAYDRWAGELGLDLRRFDAAIAAGRGKGRIEADEAQAARLGVDGTPTMIVNGELLVGAVPFETVKGVVDRKLAAR